MPKYGQLVIGPAGCGKSTFCSSIVKHCSVIKRNVFVVNLDPAAEIFDYPVFLDIRELIHIDDCMEDESMHLGPNGGLIFAMEYLVQNLDWLENGLTGSISDDDYVLFDCPGQIELYTHMPIMRRVVDALQRWEFSLCAVHLLDSQFMTEANKFMSGTLSALSSMVSLELPHINILSKCDLLDADSRKNLDRYLDPNMSEILCKEHSKKSSKRFRKLTESLCSVVEDFSLVKFLPLNLSDEHSVGDVLAQIDAAIQYGENLEPVAQEFEDLNEMQEGEMESDIFSLAQGS